MVEIEQALMLAFANGLIGLVGGIVVGWCAWGRLAAFTRRRRYLFAKARGEAGDVTIGFRNMDDAAKFMGEVARIRPND